MRRIAVLFAVFVLLIATGTTQASINVDFSVLPTTVDINILNFPPLTLNGVTFGYDTFGSTNDFASADAFRHLWDHVWSPHP